MVMRRTKPAVIGSMKPVFRIVLTTIIILVSIVLSIVIPARSYGQRQQEIRYTPDTLARLVKCPACHLEKRPPNPCPQPMQAWAWEACMNIAMKYPNE